MYPSHDERHVGGMVPMFHTERIPVTMSFTGPEFGARPLGFDLPGVSKEAESKGPSNCGPRIAARRRFHFPDRC